MKFVCLKTNNQKKIDNFLKKYNDFLLENTKISLKKFKIFYNIIIHYVGDEEEKFLYRFSIMFSEYIIENYEESFLRRCINKNYFYFDDFERELILKISLKILKLQEQEFQYKNEILTEIIYEYVLENRKMIIEGFINFRIKEYFEILDYVVELAVTSYLQYI